MSKIPLVRDFMKPSPVQLDPKLDVFHAMELILAHHMCGAPVVDASGKLLGVLSEKDCLRVFANGAFFTECGGEVEDFMTREVLSVGPDDDLFKVADLFLAKSFRRLPVVEDGKLVGQVTRHDTLMASLKLCEESPVKRPFTDAKYLSDEMKAALQQPEPTPLP